MYVCMYVWTKCTLEFKNMYVCMCVGESDSGEQEAEGGGVLPAAHGKGRQPQQAAAAVRGARQTTQQR